MPRKVYVDDLVIVRRLIEIPDKCLGCEADLTEPSAVTHWEYQDQSRTVTIMGDRIDDGTNLIEWLEDLPSGGESFIAICWKCRNCDRELASNHERRA